MKMLTISINCSDDYSTHMIFQHQTAMHKAKYHSHRSIQNLNALYYFWVLTSPRKKKKIFLLMLLYFTIKK